MTRKTTPMPGFTPKVNAVKCESCAAFLPPQLRPNLCPVCAEQIKAQAEQMAGIQNQLGVIDAILAEHTRVTEAQEQAWQLYADIERAAGQLVAALRGVSTLPESIRAEASELQILLDKAKELATNGTDDNTNTDR